ncbi:hypothetical protein [Flavobacterium phage V157]|uniref:Uncharacterized protein n=12 Tax=Ficleduovirus FCV1 TaxID=2560474 RepID=A0A218M8A4_9CAUD|nr:hypothetical protein FDG55_gp01 [Flavobacterium phage FCV-1]ASD51585.1 hypothetical protein [Flavobacterium phage FCV-3]ASD51659.1 hypothetical protein [Flavobacterium phage FCV-11]ASD51733.1 hypothetical protein [Flavobacterium phage V175]ASD51811.1 hypothetical protein [Flavobacterium phage V181]ASD52489.1 hypothetical protein [Flavobacterium phage FCV-10]ASD52562.1 hypothetical protein [Flavobacterium phage FCV-16]ASD52636.1 hypothetical protein [Flavobacterium phage FCV-20]ASD52709.1
MFFMAKYSVKDFASAYKQKESTVKSWVHRKKLQKDSDGLIDTDNAVNKLLISEMQLKVNANLIGSTSVKVAKTKSKSKEEYEQLEIPLTASQRQYQDLELRKKLADADLQERSAELKKIQLEKLAGNMLPTDFVEKAFLVNIQAIFKNFDASLENLSIIYVEEMGGDRSDVSRLTNKLRNELSRIIEKSKVDANHEIQEEIKLIIESRNQGQKK